MGIADFLSLSLSASVYILEDDHFSVAFLFAVYQDAVWHVVSMTTVEFSIDFYSPLIGSRVNGWTFKGSVGGSSSCDKPSLQITDMEILNWRCCGAACEVFTRILRLRLLTKPGGAERGVVGESTNMVCNKLNGGDSLVVSLSYWGCRSSR